MIIERRFANLSLENRRTELVNLMYFLWIYMMANETEMYMMCRWGDGEFKTTKTNHRASKQYMYICTVQHSEWFYFCYRYLVIKIEEGG